MSEAFFEGAHHDLFMRIPEDLHRTPREVHVPDPPPVLPIHAPRRLSVIEGQMTGEWHIFEHLETGGLKHIAAFATRDLAQAALRSLQASEEGA